MVLGAVNDMREYGVVLDINVSAKILLIWAST